MVRCWDREEPVASWGDSPADDADWKLDCDKDGFMP